MSRLGFWPKAAETFNSPLLRSKLPTDTTATSSSPAATNCLPDSPPTPPSLARVDFQTAEQLLSESELRASSGSSATPRPVDPRSGYINSCILYTAKIRTSPAVPIDLQYTYSCGRLCESVNFPNSCSACRTSQAAASKPLRHAKSTSSAETSPEGGGVVDMLARLEKTTQSLQVRQGWLVCLAALRQSTTTTVSSLLNLCRVQQLEAPLWPSTHSCCPAHHKHCSALECCVWHLGKSSLYMGC